MVQYPSYGTAEGITFYENLNRDIIAGVTSALIHNLGTRNFQLAMTDYQRLLSTIKTRGYQGKDIRYVGKELGELSKSARESGSEDIARIAAMLAGQLPGPLQERKRNRRSLEFMIA